MSARGYKFHRKLRCEFSDCDNTFFVYGRHHCRSCGASVCTEHFVRPHCNTCHILQGAISCENRGMPRPKAAEPTTGCEEDAAMPPRGTEECELCKDVYATVFTLANNATPGMYSVWPWRNKDMFLAWRYLGFTVFAQVHAAS